MAFSFGASSPATSTFSGFGFGSSTPAFGSSASAPAFGASTPAFGAQPSLFGSQSANAFGASSSSFSFQTPAPAQSTPGFSFQTPGQSSAGFGSGTNIFGSSSPSLFGTSAPAFGAGFGATSSSQPQAGNALALAAQPGQQLQFQQHHQLHQQQQQVLYAAAAQYVTKQNQPLTHRTQWDDIGPNGQSNLLEIEKLVAQQRDGCRRLDAAAAQPQGRPSSQIQPSKSSQQRHALKQGMQAEARPLHLALQLLNDKVTTDSQAALQCEERDMELMQDVELGIRAFQCCVLWTHAHQAGHQLSAADRERLSTPPILPSPFLCHSIPHLQEKADECTKLVSELERVLPASALQQAHASRSSSGSKQATQMMETALLNMHDYFVHVAARVAALQEATEAAREAHLRSKRLAGNSSNPFEAADLREAAAAAEAARAAAQAPPASSSAPATAGPGASGPAPLALGAPGQPSPSALPSSQTPSLFPAATPAASSAAGGFGGGFLFGQTGAASNPAQTPGFGFGATPAASPAAGGLFGGISPASALAGNSNQSGSRKSSTKRR